MVLSNRKHQCGTVQEKGQQLKADTICTSKCMTREALHAYINRVRLTAWAYFREKYHNFWKYAHPTLWSIGSAMLATTYKKRHTYTTRVLAKKHTHSHTHTHTHTLNSSCTIWMHSLKSEMTSPTVKLKQQSWNSPDMFMHTEQLTDWSLSSDWKVNEDEPATQLSLTPVNTSHREAVISAYNSPGLQNM